MSAPGHPIFGGEEKNKTVHIQVRATAFQGTALWENSQNKAWQVMPRECGQ